MEQPKFRKSILFNSLPHILTTKKKPFQNIAWKGENAGNQHFLLFTQCFLPSQNKKFQFFNRILSSANATSFDQSKILLFGKKLNSVKCVHLKLKIMKQPCNSTPDDKILD